MSTAAPPSASNIRQDAGPQPVRELCPLCGAPLQREQEWCLRCGAAARTRLAPTPRWRGMLLALALAVVLCLGVLAAALVKLAADSGPAPRAPTRTVTTAAAAPSTTLPLARPGATGLTGASSPRAGSGLAARSKRGARTPAAEAFAAGIRKQKLSPAVRRRIGEQLRSVRSRAHTPAG